MRSEGSWTACWRAQRRDPTPKIELKVGEVEAKANAAIWEAFFETTSRKYGVRVDQLLEDHGVDPRRVSQANLEQLTVRSLEQTEGATQAEQFKQLMEALELEGRVFAEGRETKTLARARRRYNEIRKTFGQERIEDWKAPHAQLMRDNVIPEELRAAMERALVSQRRASTTKAEGPPPGEAEPPPPPGEAGPTGRPEARGIDQDWRERAGETGAPAREIQRLPLSDPKIAEKVDTMLAVELGWEQIGGRRADVSVGMTSGQPNFTSWIPKSEVWPGRPAKHLNEAKVRRAVEKARAGEPLGKAEQATVDYLVEIANKRLADIEEMGGPEEWNATARDVAQAELEPSTQNVVDADAVARAAEVDELAVERAAQKYENDDAAFMAEIRRIGGERKEAEPGETTGERGQEGAGEAPGEPGAGQPDPLREAALRFVEEDPERLIAAGTDAQGNPVYKTLRQYLDDELIAAREAREDIRLIEAAATCLYGRA